MKKLSKKNKRFLFDVMNATCVLAALNAADVAFTHYYLSHGGVEANPLMAPLSITQMAMVKCGLVALAAWLTARWKSSLGLWLMRLCCLAYAVLVGYEFWLA